MEKTKTWRDYYNPEVNKKATKKYREKHLTSFNFVLHNEGDWDIISKLESLGKGGKAGYIKGLIRDDIKRTGFDPGPKPTKPGAPPDPSTLPPVEPVPTVDMDEWRKEHPELIPPEELSKEEALKLLGM